MLFFTFDSGGIPGAPAFLTQGATGKDFADAGGTCEEFAGLGWPVAKGDSCTLDVTLTPASAGMRLGAVELTGTGGNVLATAYVYGVGNGPAVAIDPGTASALGFAGGGGNPKGVATDAAGNVYYSLANGQELYSTPGGPFATNAGSGLNGPGQVAVDGAGNVFVADSGGNRIAEYVGGATTPITAVGGLNTPTGVAVDGAGNLYIGDTGNGRILFQPAGGGTPTVLVSDYTFPMQTPTAIALDVAGNVYFVDTGAASIDEIPAGNGTPFRVAGGPSSGIQPTGLAVDAAGDIVYTDMGSKQVIEIPISGSNIVLAGGLKTPVGVALDPSGNLYVADTSSTSGILAFTRAAAAAHTLNFASTGVGSTSADSPQTLTVGNIGNVALNLPAPATGYNPSIATGFTLGSYVGSDCPLVGSGASAGTLNPGAYCLLPVSFVPASAESYNGSTLGITDNALNASAPNYTTQTITLNGTGTGAPQTILFTMPGSAIYNGVSLTDTLSATGGGSGNPVTFTLDSTSPPGIAGLSGPNNSTLTISGTGVVIIDANQAAGGNYAAATQVQQTILVTLDTAASIAATVGSTPQSARVGAAFTNALQVKVADGGGNGVYGVTVTFAAPSSGASATLSSLNAITDQNGMASVAATANGTAGGYLVTASYPGSGYAIFSLTNLPPPVYTVTTLTDDNPNNNGTGNASLCNDTSQGATPNFGCSLRDAIAAAAAVNTSTVTPTVNFAATQSTSSGNITLTPSTPGDYNVTTGGTLNISNNMNIVGPGANLLSIDGKGTAQVFNIYGGTVTISGVSIVNGNTISSGGNVGGGINNSGTLTVTNSTFSGNTAANGGGGIFNENGTLTVANSTFSGNSANTGGGSGGGGIYNWATLTVTGSTFSGNNGGYGGGIYNPNGIATVANSTFSANTASSYGGGIYNSGTATVTNSTFSGNTAPSGSGAGLYNDGQLTLANDLSVDGANGSNIIDMGGNKIAGILGVTAGNLPLAPLSYYGGTTQTMPPVPGSAAICAGTTANATAAGLTTDQRGNPRSTTVYGSTACVDAGAVQTAYSLSFTTSPSNSQKTNVALTPAPVVQLSDNGSIISLPGAPITLALYAGAISGGIPTVGTAPNGVSTFSGVTVTTPETGDYLIARAPVGPYSISANSSNSPFNVIALTLSPAAGPLSPATYGAAYSQTFTANGGTTPYTYSATGLPPGLSINSGTGMLTGTPTSIAGSPYTVVVTVTDSASNTIHQSYTLAVGPAASAISVSGSVNPVFVQDTVTYTAAVGFVTAPSSSTVAGPIGTVTFSDGTTPITACTGLTLGAYSSATGAALAACPVSYTSTTPATHSITATYTSSNANFTGSASGTLTEALEDFTVTAQNATLTVQPGAAGQYTFTLSPQSPATTFPTAINLTVSGLPPGATGTFSPSATIAAGATAATVTLTIQTAQTTSQNSPNTGGGLASRLAGISLALLLLPFVGKLRKTGKRFSRMLPILLLLIASMAAVVGLNGCGGKSGPPPQSYTVGVTATSGTLSHTSNITLTVE
jgi:CSLREA domain-containing protein